MRDLFDGHQNGAHPHRQPPPVAARPFRASRLIEEIQTLPIGAGELTGQAYSLYPAQRRFIRGAFRPGKIISALSQGRGGGKSGLGSALSLDSILPDHELHRPGGETILVASSFSQAKITFDAVLHSLRIMFVDNQYRIRDSDTRAEIEHRASGARLRCIGSDHKRAHGLRPLLMIADEPSQWGPSGGKLSKVVNSSMGKWEHARAIYLGTKAESPLHFYNRILESTANPDRYIQLHAAGKADPVGSARTWRKANPGLEYGLPHRAVLEAEYRAALADASEMVQFKALRLNMGLRLDSDESDLVLEPDLVEAMFEPWEAPRRGPYVLGADLGETASLSAVAGYWPETGRLEVLSATGGEPNLEARGQRDGVNDLYVLAHQAGELLVKPGRSLPDVLGLFDEAEARWGRPVRVVCDSWRYGELKDALRDLEWHVRIEKRRGGPRDGGEDLRAFRTAAHNGNIHSPPAILLSSILAEAVTISDGRGNTQLAKKAQGGRRMRLRDDPLAAAILAVSSGVRDGAGHGLVFASA